MMIAIGFACPDCGYEGEHNANLVGNFLHLHCRKCERLWTEELWDDDDA